LKSKDQRKKELDNILKSPAVDVGRKKCSTTPSTKKIKLNDSIIFYKTSARLRRIKRFKSKIASYEHYITMPKHKENINKFKMKIEHYKCRIEEANGVKCDDGK